MKTCLVVHPDFNVVGGAERVAGNFIQWLADNAGMEVTLLSLFPPSASALEKAGVAPEIVRRLKLATANCPGFVREAPGSMYLLRLAFLHRSAKALSGMFEVCVSTYNELDFGKPGIQYIHHPSFANRALLKEMHILGRQSVLDRVPQLELIHRKIVSRISGDTEIGFARNLTLVNSVFMRDLVSRAYGFCSEVVYPAAVVDLSNIGGSSWMEREERFVTISRIAADKGLLALIDLFSSLQKEFPRADFAILGRGHDTGYENLLSLRAKELGVRLKIVKDLSDREMKAYLEKTKYYVQGKVNEHFGIAVVEAVAAGCLVMVHDSGGPTEIVQRSDLRFNSSEDLISKIKRLIDDPPLRFQVISDTQAGLSRFTLSAFNSRLDATIRPFLGN